MIERHSFTLSKMPNSDTMAHYEQRLANSYNRLEEGKKVVFFYLKNTPLSIARTKIILSEKVDEICMNLRLYCDLGINHFKRRLATAPISIELANRKFEVEPINDKEGFGFDNWFYLFSIASLIRSKNHFHELLNLKEVYDLNVEDQTFWRYAVKFSMALLNDDREDVDELMIKLREKANSESYLFIGIDGQRMVESRNDSIIEGLNILFLPLFELYYLAYNQKEEEFNNTLEQYLINKKSYIIKREEEDHADYWVDFDALGVCAYAYDKGINIRVESEYIPKWVYDGSVCNLTPTA